MSDIITPDDLPPINELDEFTSHIPELQIDTDVLAGTGGPANFQAQALANRTKHLKRVLDAVSQQLTGISQAVAAAQQSADTAKQGADASMKKAANGSDIANPAAFRTSIGLSNAMLAGQFGWGGRAVNIGNVDLFSYFTRERPAGLYWGNQETTNRPSGFADVTLLWSPIEHADFYGTLTAIGFTTGGIKVAHINVSGGAWGEWRTGWDSGNLNPVTVNTSQGITGRKTFITNWASVGIQPAEQGGASYFQGEEYDGSSRWYLGYPNPDNDSLVLYNIKAGIGITLNQDATVNIDAPLVTFTQGKGFVRNNRAASPEFANVTELLASWRGEQSMGSAVTNDNFVWRSFINVRHRGGNSNGENGATDSGDWGFVFLDDDMTGNNHRFRIMKMRAGVWGAGVDLYHTGNTTVGSGGALLAASPVINIYSDGSFTANDDATGVNVERLSEGVYKITGCCGMNSDPAWNGIDGGVKNPVCRNDKALLWNNYEVDEDGSITVYTFHRVHIDAMPFAQNRLTLDKEPFDSEKGHTPEMEWPDQAPIDVPNGFFIQVRVNMPEREEAPYVPTMAPESVK